MVEVPTKYAGDHDGILEQDECFEKLTKDYKKLARDYQRLVGTYRVERKVLAGFKEIYTRACQDIQAMLADLLEQRSKLSELVGNPSA